MFRRGFDFLDCRSNHLICVSRSKQQSLSPSVSGTIVLRPFFFPPKIRWWIWYSPCKERIPWKHERGLRSLLDLEDLGRLLKLVGVWLNWVTGYLWRFPQMIDTPETCMDHHGKSICVFWMRDGIPWFSVKLPPKQDLLCEKLGDLVDIQRP